LVRLAYQDAAIQTTLTVRIAFKLPLRQTEGLLASVITLMDLTISAPALHGQPPGSGAAGDPGGHSAARSVAPIDRQHRVAGLGGGSGGRVWGAGQWLEAKHGVKSRRKWRKLHLAIDAETSSWIASHPVARYPVARYPVARYPVDRRRPDP